MVEAGVVVNLCEGSIYVRDRIVMDFNFKNFKQFVKFSKKVKKNMDSKKFIMLGNETEAYVLRVDKIESVEWVIE